MKLIDADATLEALINKGQTSRRYKLGEIWELNGQEIREALNTVPSAQKKGHWIDEGTNYLCSECHRGCWVNSNYCPWCGADMREESKMIKNCPMRHENGNCLPAGGFCTANKDICEALHNAYEFGRESAQSKIIRCKDCKYNVSSHKCLHPESFFLVPADDFYCEYAERRTDGKTT